MELIGLHAKFTADNSQLKAATREAVTLVDQFGRSLTKTAVAEDTAATAAKRLTTEYNKLRMQYDGAYASAQRYQKAADVIRRTAEQQGWSIDRLNNELQQMARHYNIAEAAGENFNRMVRTSRFHTANLAAQFNDIGVMMASGQSPFILAVQQGTQVSQVLQSMGGTARQQLGALAAAFRAVISPSALLTVGVIAGAAALYQWAAGAFEASDEADKLAEAMGRIDEKVAEVNLRYAAFLNNLKDTDEYLLTQEIIRVQDELNSLLAEANSLDVEAYQFQMLKVDAAREELATLNQRLEKLHESRKQEEVIEGHTGRITDNMKTFVDWLGDAIDRGDALAKSMQDVAIFTERMSAAIARGGAEQYDGGPDAARSKMFGGGEFTPAVRGAGLAAGRRSAGGGGAGAADPIIGRLSALQDALKTEVELEKERFAERQTILEEALQKQLLTQQEYSLLMQQTQEQHSNRMAQLDVWRYGDSLQKTSAFLGDMASAFQGGNEKMLRISKAFGAAQALISAYQGAAEALKLPFPQNLAAFAAVLAKGLSAVAAIKRVSPGGGAVGGGLGGSAGATVAAPTYNRTANFTIQGDVIGKQTGAALVAEINKATKAGYRINLEWAGITP